MSGKYCSSLKAVYVYEVADGLIKGGSVSSMGGRVGHNIKPRWPRLLLHRSSSRCRVGGSNLVYFSRPDITVLAKWP